MTEIANILSAWHECLQRGESCALATVVRLDGSGYRRPGARMLILADGATIGSVSGGCLERDVVHRAGAVAAGGEPVLVRYDAMSEEEAGPGASLGCGGTIDILIERADANSLAQLHWLWSRRRRGAIVTVIAKKNLPIQIGARAALEETGQVQFTGDELSAAPLLEEARAAIELAQSRRVRHGADDGWMDLFIEYIQPPLELLLFGGPDALPLADLGRSLGWRVTIIDLRRSTAPLDRLQIPPDCAAVVMNHHWKNDLAVLRRLGSASLKYLGVLGPRRRTLRLLSRLGDAAPSAEYMRFPVGLDIGAETPQEVALAIVAEITCVLRGGSGAALHDKAGPIHAAPQEESPLTCPTVAS
jgi:xanthine/CO dehydrogenase XdhC/CoxF family maturation factor